MKKKLLIHMGTPKTGSSFLQAVFRQYSDKLADCGVLYPSIINGVYSARLDLNSESIYRNISGQLLTKIFRLSNALDYRELLGDVSQLIAELFELGYKNVFLSDETLGVLNPVIWKLFAEVCDSQQIDLIVFGYYRNPVSYYPSHWSQVVRKHGEMRGLIDFSRENDLPVWRHLIEMSKTIEASYVFDYDELTRQDKLLISAFRVLGAEENIISQVDTRQRVNDSLSLQTLTAIRFVNEEYGQSTGQKVEEIITSSKKLNSRPSPKLPKEIGGLINKRHSTEMAACSLLFESAQKTLNLG